MANTCIDCGCEDCIKCSQCLHYGSQGMPAEEFDTDDDPCYWCDNHNNFVKK